MCLTPEYNNDLIANLEKRFSKIEYIVGCNQKEKKQLIPLSCPFCGHKPEVIKQFHINKIPTYYIECRNNLCCHPKAEAYSKKGAIKKWNRRIK